MDATRRGETFDEETLRRLGAAEVIRLRAGSGNDHRPTTVWVVVVGDGAYVRSYSGRGGWHAVLAGDPAATIYLDSQEIPAHAVPVGDAGTVEAVSEAIREKYGPINPGYVPPFMEGGSPATTTRLEPPAPVPETAGEERSGNGDDGRGTRGE